MKVDEESHIGGDEKKIKNKQKDKQKQEKSLDLRL